MEAQWLQHSPPYQSSSLYINHWYQRGGSGLYHFSKPVHFQSRIFHMHNKVNKIQNPLSMTTSIKVALLVFAVG